MAKVAVVTGSNKGIGFAIVRGLCKKFDGTVYLTSRSEDLGKSAVADLGKEGLHPEYHQLDITDIKSIEVFRDFLKEKHGGIDVLVNNAAIAFKSASKDPVAVQAEQTIAVNYFGVLNTCERLLPLVRNGGRVVNISSSAGLLTNIPSIDLRKRLQDPSLTVPELSELMKRYVEAAKQGTHAAEWGNSSYCVSKVGLTALTMIQQRMLNDRDIKVNAVHPGYVATDMSSQKGNLTINQGAEAPLFLALDAPDTVKGQYVWYNKEIVNWSAHMGGSTSKINKLIECLEYLQSDGNYSTPETARRTSAAAERAFNLIFGIGIDRLQYTEEQKQRVGALVAGSLRHLQAHVERVGSVYRTRLDHATLRKRSALQFLIDHYGDFPAQGGALTHVLDQANINESTGILDDIIAKWHNQSDSEEVDSDTEIKGLPNSHTWWCL